MIGKREARVASECLLKSARLGQLPKSGRHERVASSRCGGRAEVQVVLAEWQVAWLNCSSWDLEQVLYWNFQSGRLPIDQLLGGLQEGRIPATGRRVVYEANRPPKLGDREPIPALAWLDLIIIACDYTGELHVYEWDAHDGVHGLLAWRDVRIKREDALTYLGFPSSTQQPAVRRRPGRPTSKDLYLQELEARIKAGEVAPSLQAEATYLKNWLEKNHPNARRSALSTIRNNIRKRYNEAKCQA
jgi:hypothetical protein